MSALPNPTGRIATGHHPDTQTLIIFIQPHGDIGIDIAGLRDLCTGLGLSSAVYLGGSDSVMLMIDHTALIRQGSNKNETNVTGIGFRY